MVSFNSIFNLVAGAVLSSVLIQSTVALPAAEKADFVLPPFIEDRLIVHNHTLEARATTSTPTASELVNLKKYAEISATAYCRTVVPLNSWNCAHCKTSVPDGVLVKTFTSLIDDTNGFILRSDKDKTIYLVFRGTNSFRSAIVDAQYILSVYPGVTGAFVHFGFLNSYNAVVNDYFPVLQSQLSSYPSYNVIVTGHSLGAAQALLAGLDLYKRESRLNSGNLKIFTYGCPRVGNPIFANYAAGTGISHTRVVHGADIVPQVPPVISGYLHSGVENWIYADPDSVRICTSTTESALCSNTLLLTSLTDHITYFGINEGLCT